jgi:hypothetical protein
MACMLLLSVMIGSSKGTLYMFTLFDPLYDGACVAADFGSFCAYYHLTSSLTTLLQCKLKLL